MLMSPASVFTTLLIPSVTRLVSVAISVEATPVPARPPSLFMIDTLSVLAPCVAAITIGY